MASDDKSPPPGAWIFCLGCVLPALIVLICGSLAVGWRLLRGGGLVP